MNEADTCRTLVRPKLETAGGDGNKHFYSEQTAFTDVLEVPPISTHGNVVEIGRKFGGSDRLIAAVGELQTLLYAA